MHVTSLALPQIAAIIGVIAGVITIITAFFWLFSSRVYTHDCHKCHGKKDIEVLGKVVQCPACLGKGCIHSTEQTLTFCEKCKGHCVVQSDKHKARFCSHCKGRGLSKESVSSLVSVGDSSIVIWGFSFRSLWYSLKNLFA